MLHHNVVASILKHMCNHESRIMNRSGSHESGAWSQGKSSRQIHRLRVGLVSRFIRALIGRYMIATCRRRMGEPKSWFLSCHLAIDDCW